jgi:hypothetical protein
MDRAVAAEEEEEAFGDERSMAVAMASEMWVGAMRVAATAAAATTVAILAKVVATGVAAAPTAESPNRPR